MDGVCSVVLTFSYYIDRNVIKWKITIKKYVSVDRSDRAVYSVFISRYSPRCKCRVGGIAGVSTGAVPPSNAVPSGSVVPIVKVIIECLLVENCCTVKFNAYVCICSHFPVSLTSRRQHFEVLGAHNHSFCSKYKAWEIFSSVYSSESERPIALPLSTSIVWKGLPAQWHSNRESEPTQQ